MRSTDRVDHRERDAQIRPGKPPTTPAAHGFGLRDGCWNPVSSGGADPRGVDTQAGEEGRGRAR